jgi:butyryl-CoA dehydrogenase
MPRSLADQLQFLLDDWLDAGALAAYPLYAHLDRATLQATLEAAARLAREQFAPHAAKSDACEPRLVAGRVELIPEIGTALSAYREAGMYAAGTPLAEGGLGLPQVMRAALTALFAAANVGTTGYPFLTKAAANLLRASGSAEQKRRYLPRLASGEWFGTMCLSEPQAGSSLGDIRCLAAPQADGRYHLRGTKMWISGGDHELAANIVHFVLARLPDAPAGTRGISLFIVPRFTVDADGALGARNGIVLAGLNHKLGYRGTVNCLLNLGEAAPCVGELVGAPHQGLKAMFRMMNEARIGVGIGAAALGWAGYAAARDYAHERTQGRAIGAAPDTPMVALSEHADVRRMLLKARAQAEGALALCLYAARLADEAACGDADAHAVLELLTPVVKAWPAQYALEANDLAIQVLGGAGYTRDFAVERLWRDNRLNAIHEGTNGIQALDLLGRKVLGDGGRALGLLGARLQARLAAAQATPSLAPLLAELAPFLSALGEAVQAVAALAARGELDAALANASLFLDAFGHVVVAALWLDQAALAERQLAAGARGARAERAQGVLACARYFVRWELPPKRHALTLLARADRTLLETPPAVL